MNQPSNEIPAHLNAHQRTLAKPVRIKGHGVHFNRDVNITLNPADVNYGIKFQRVDLPDKPIIPAHFHNVVDTSMATVIGQNDIVVSTIEHLMASFAGMGVDNVLVEIDAQEVPIIDGSAAPFTQAIREAGFKIQKGPRAYFKVTEPIELSRNGDSFSIVPHATFKVTGTIEYDHPLIGTQTKSLEITDTTFEEEISTARTFGFLSQYEQLKRYGLSQGCSLDNVVVVGETTILNEGGLRFDDEFVRHKILDCLGDISLLGMPIIGHIICHRTGHRFNHHFLHKFLQSKGSWEAHTVEPA